MEKSQENPKPRGVPVADAPPPPTALSGGATPIPTHKHNHRDKQPPSAAACVKSVTRNFMVTMSYLLLVFVWRNIFLGFKLDSVSVSIHDDSRANVTAVWDIAFSTQPFVPALNVTVRFMSRDFKLDNVEVANGIGTVSMSLPRDFVYPTSGGLMLEQVVFESNFEPRYGVKAACENVTVGFLSDGTKGVMQGGPIWCPIVRYGHIF